MEKEFKAEIFIANTGFDWRLNSNKLYYGGSVLLIPFLILAQYFDFNTEFIQGISFGLIMLIVLGIRWRYSEKQKMFGKLNGTIQINDQFISINDKEYLWDEISNFSFNLLHVLEEQFWSDTYPINRYYFSGPAYSAGVDNYIEFNFKKELHSVFFQLKTHSHKTELSNILKRHFIMGHIELHRTYDGLHLEYEEIQELKKQKLEGTTVKSV